MSQGDSGFQPSGGQQNQIYFSNEAVNRVSFLREDSDFITNAVSHPSTRFVFFEGTNPLINKSAETDKLIVLTNGAGQLSSVEAGSGTPVTHGLRANSTWQSIIDTWSSDNKEQSPSLRDNQKPTFLFLGLKDGSVGLNLSALKAGELEPEPSSEGDHDTTSNDEERYLDHQGRYQGIPYFAVDVTQSPQVTELVIDHLLKYSNAASRESLIFSTSRKHYFGFSSDEAALYSHGKMFLDWLYRNKFCPGCGSKVIPIHAGGKLHCTNEARQSSRFDEEKQREIEVHDCPVKNLRVSNVSFPRTDAVIITAITNQDRTKVLLSLSKRYAFSKMYSCTAGFMEPSESVEVATKREIWEETGVVCSDINIVMTQPWPFPANLMIGCIGVVDFNGVNESIHLGHDRELADARWFDIEFVKKLVYDEGDNESNPEGIVLPGDISIAHSLIKMVVDQRRDMKL